MHRSFMALILAAAAFGMAGPPAQAQDSSSAPPVSRHRMMKECMAKQKASDGGMPKEQMKRACKDVTKNERENAKTEQKQEAGEKSAATPQP